MCEIIDAECPTPFPHLVGGDMGELPGNVYNVESKCSYFPHFRVEKIMFFSSHICQFKVNVSFSNALNVEMYMKD